MSKSERNKRTRAENFTQDEKLLLVRLVQKYGQAIVKKLAIIDSDSNKEKENEWKKITETLNAVRNSNRKTSTLKNAWTKLKGDAKVYKTALRSVPGNTGSPTPCDDSVLDLVHQVLAAQDTGPLLNYGPCITIDGTNDSNNATDTTKTSLSDNPDCNETLKTVNPDEIPEGEEGLITSNDSESDISDDSDLMGEDEPEIELPSSNVKNQSTSLLAVNERTAIDLVRAKLLCKLADEKLLTQREKKKNIMLQQQQMMELHNAKLENEKLKKILLKNLIRKVKKGEIKEAARKTTLEEILRLESI